MCPLFCHWGTRCRRLLNHCSSSVSVQTGQLLCASHYMPIGEIRDHQAVLIGQLRSQDFWDQVDCSGWFVYTKNLDYFSGNHILLWACTWHSMQFPVSLKAIFIRSVSWPQQCPTMLVQSPWQFKRDGQCSITWIFSDSKNTCLALCIVQGHIQFTA